MPYEDKVKFTIKAKYEPNGIDDLIERMQQDELEDAVSTGEQITLTPVKYGKLRGIWPQRVYQAIRSGKLKTQICGCGRKTIDIAEADTLFGFLKEDHETETE